MTLLSNLVFIAVGLGHQAAARLAPFREQLARRELGLDLAAAVFGSLCAVVYAAYIAEPLVGWLEGHAALQRWQGQVAALPWGLSLALNIVIADFAIYWSHRALHSRALWPTHAWHHSARHVWWLSGLRASPVHVVMTILPFTLVGVLVPVAELRVVLVFMIFLGALNQHWLHSNIEIPHARVVERLFVTPRCHFVHHSATIERTNSNYGFIFSVWDRLFGTFVDPDGVALDDPLGLDYEASPLRLALGLPARLKSPADADPTRPRPS